MKLVNWQEGVEAVKRFEENKRKDRELFAKYWNIVGINGREEEAKTIWKEIRTLWWERRNMLGN